ncbi:MAG: hypothetical protein Tsb008_21000 [Rhodothalassiaceae bacterium]
MTELYYKWFEVVRCTTPSLIEEAQKLRYQVYCVETGFEDPAANPDGLERDDADAHAIHSILVHKPSGLVAGTVRLILPNEDSPDLGLAARHVSPVLQQMDESELPRARTAEISRFSISKAFRKRVEDTLYPAGVEDMSEPDWLGRRALPSITLGLMRAIVAMTREADMSHVVAVVEPALVRLLFRMGINFSRTGERVSYHGERYPVYRKMTDLLDEIFVRHPEIWHVITEGGKVWPLGGFEPRMLRA